MEKNKTQHNKSMHPQIINQNKCTTTQNNHKKTKPGLLAFYDIWPRNGENLFLFLQFIVLPLAYLDTYPLTAPGPRGAPPSAPANSRFVGETKSAGSILVFFFQNTSGIHAYSSQTMLPNHQLHKALKELNSNNPKQGQSSSGPSPSISTPDSQSKKRCSLHAGSLT